MEFDPFGLSVKDLSTRNVITGVIVQGLSTPCACHRIPLLRHQLLLLQP
jgi:hypothetical protein